MDNQGSVRRHNLSVVLRHVVEHGSCSRGDIADRTELNRATVSSLVAELIERGLLVERGSPKPAAPGRPARSVELAPNGVVGLGLEVGEEHVATLAVARRRRVRYRSAVMPLPGSARAEDALDRLALLAEDAIRALRADGLEIM